MPLLDDVANAVNLTTWNPDTNTMLGDVNSDGKVDGLDVEIVDKLAVLTSDPNAAHYIEDVLGLSQTNLSALAAKASEPRFVTALSDGQYTFTDLEFLIRYADLNGDGAVNFKDTEIFARNALFYEFIAYLKEEMQRLEYIPSATYASLQLSNFESWDEGLKQQFIARANEFLTTMDVTQGIEEYRDYNGDGKVDFKDKDIFEHYGAWPITSQQVIDSVEYRIDVNGDGLVTIDDTEDGFNDLATMRDIFNLTHEAVSPEDLLRADMDGNGVLDAVDTAIFREMMKSYKDLNGDNRVDMNVCCVHCVVE
jgi:hypothetical protein